MRHTCKLLSWRNRSVHVPSNEKLNLAGFRSELVQPNPTSFLGLNQILDPKFGLSQVGLASNRVQIRVQPYNVLNKPEMNLI